MPGLLFVSHAAELGGAEEVLLDVTRHFGPARCHVALFADGPLRSRLEQTGIGVTVLQADAQILQVRRQSGVLPMLRSLPGLVRLGLRLAGLARRFDVIYANSQKAAVMTMLIGRMIRRPVIWHLHDILSAEHFGWAQRFGVTRLANLGARRVIAISDVCRTSFIACGGNPRLVVAVPSAVDPAAFLAITDHDAAAMRRLLGFDSATKLIGLFGRITQWKGQHVLVRALRHLPDAHALIVGSAMFGQADYERELMQLAQELGVAGRIHWLGYRTDVPVLMRMVDVVVHTSVSPEPFGRVIVEGLLAGRPVLASEHGASAELLGLHSPWLVEPNNPAALAESIRLVLDTAADTLNEQVETHRAHIASVFSLPKMMTGIEQIVGLPA